VGCGNDCPALRAVRGEQPAEQRDRCLIEAQCGFIQKPKRCGRQNQTGQGQSSALACRKQARRQILQSRKPDRSQRRLHGTLADTGEEAKILGSGQGRFDAVGVAEISDVTGMLHGICQRIFALPEKRAGNGPQKPGKHAQKGGLAGAIRPHHHQCSTCRQSKPDIPKDKPFTAEDGESLHL